MSLLDRLRLPWFFAVAILPVALLMAGCGENDGRVPVPSHRLVEDGLGANTPDPEAGAGIIESIIKLIETAPENPGGANFTMAAERLNDYFLGTSPEEFGLPEQLQRFLSTQQLPPGADTLIARSKFDGMRDGRHLEDSLLLKTVTASILARGGPMESDLAKAKCLFDWVIRQVQLVPEGTLAPPEHRGPKGEPMQAWARPYDVLLRGLATETGEGWAERSWVFIALCRQAKLDAAYLVLVPGRGAGGIMLRDGVVSQRPVPFACGVLIEGQIYLFDARHGFAIPGLAGRGVATLEQAATNPAILEALDLPAQPYPLQRSDLRSGKMRVLLDATSATIAPRFRLLQERLTKDYRMELYQDPTVLGLAFAKALGPRLESIQLWDLPMKVEHLLFRDDSFNQSTGYAVRYFNPQWPLLKARLRQLRGELDEAIKGYVSFRLAHDAMQTDGNPIPPHIQQVLDIYATQFLALAQLETGRDEEARFLFGESLRMLPDPGPGRPYYTAFRWGAARNLGLLCEAAGEKALAVRYLTLEDPTDQSFGNKLRANALILSDPFVPPDDLVVPPPPPPYVPPVKAPADRRVAPRSA